STGTREWHQDYHPSYEEIRIQVTGGTTGPATSSDPRGTNGSYIYNEVTLPRYPLSVRGALTWKTPESIWKASGVLLTAYRTTPIRSGLVFILTMAWSAPSGEAPGSLIWRIQKALSYRSERSRSRSLRTYSLICLIRRVRSKSYFQTKRSFWTG